MSSKLISKSYRISHDNAEHIQLQVDIDLESRKATIIKMPHKQGDQTGKALAFVKSDPTLIRRMGEVLAEAGAMAEDELAINQDAEEPEE